MPSSLRRITLTNFIEFQSQQQPVSVFSNTWQSCWYKFTLTLCQSCKNALTFRSWIFAEVTFVLRLSSIIKKGFAKVSKIAEIRRITLAAQSRTASTFLPPFRIAAKVPRQIDGAGILFDCCWLLVVVRILVYNRTHFYGLLWFNRFKLGALHSHWKWKIWIRLKKRPNCESGDLIVCNDDWNDFLLSKLQRQKKWPFFVFISTSLLILRVRRRLPQSFGIFEQGTIGWRFVPSLGVVAWIPIVRIEKNFCSICSGCLMGAQTSFFLPRNKCNVCFCSQIWLNSCLYREKLFVWSLECFRLVTGLFSDRSQCGMRHCTANLNDTKFTSDCLSSAFGSL